MCQLCAINVLISDIRWVCSSTLLHRHSWSHPLSLITKLNLLYVTSPKGNMIGKKIKRLILRHTASTLRKPNQRLELLSQHSPRRVETARPEILASKRCSRPLNHPFSSIRCAAQSHSHQPLLAAYISIDSFSDVADPKTTPPSPPRSLHRA